MKGVICVIAAATFGATAPASHAWPGCEVDHLAAVAEGDTITVFHEDAAYDCCLDGVAYDVSYGGTVIFIVETEVVSESCPCLCCYDLSVSIGGLAPDDYTVYFSYYERETHQWVDWIESVAVESGEGGTPSIVATTNSGCIDPTAAPLPATVPDTWGRVKALYR